MPRSTDAAAFAALGDAPIFSNLTRAAAASYHVHRGPRGQPQVAMGHIYWGEMILRQLRAQLRYASHQGVDFTLGRMWASVRCLGLRPACSTRVAADASPKHRPDEGGNQWQSVAIKLRRGGGEGGRRTGGGRADGGAGRAGVVAGIAADVAPTAPAFSCDASDVLRRPWHGNLPPAPTWLTPTVRPEALAKRGACDDGYFYCLGGSRMCDEAQRATDAMDRIEVRALYVGCADRLCQRLPQASLNVHGRRLGRARDALVGDRNASLVDSSVACAGALLSLLVAVHSDAPLPNRTLAFDLAAAEGTEPERHAGPRSIAVLSRRARELVGPVRRSALRAACPIWQLKVPGAAPDAEVSAEAMEEATRGASSSPDPDGASSSPDPDGPISSTSRPQGVVSSTIRVGYCATTDNGPSDCINGHKGSVPRLPDLQACVGFCQQCARCRFISYSTSHADCSWFSHCRAFERGPVLGLDFGGATYVSMQVKEHFNASSPKRHG